MATLMLEEKKGKWVEAYDDKLFQKRLLDYRNIIEEKLNEFISSVKKERKDLMMFESLESRIKPTDSFTEKLSRNGYLYDWELTQEKKQDQDYLLVNLPDIIGYRISCYFNQDEEKIYELLLHYNFNNIVLNRDTNTKQSNGHPIYKLEGVYEEGGIKCNFEIQIKSLVHNIWGEVEHKTIYKRKGYDFNISNRKEITESAYNILRATDGQLNSLFEMDYNTEKLIKSLFYEQTKAVIKEEYLTDILGKAYNNFFELFYDKYKDYFQKHVAMGLLGEPLEQIEVDSIRTDEQANLLKENISMEFREYDFAMIKTISNLILKYESDLDYYKVLLDILLPQNVPDAFGDEEDFSDEDEPDNYMDDVQIVLDRMKDRLDLKEVKRYA